MIDRTTGKATGRTQGPLGPKWIRLVGLGLLAYLIMVGYALARPSVESLFLEHHGARALPRVWLGVALVAALVVAVYNRLVCRASPLIILVGICTLASGLLIAFLSVLKTLPGPTTAGLYIWKDVYIVVLVEIFWTFANLVFPIKTARWAYGFFALLGSVGHFSGNLAVKVIAERWQTSTALWASLPLFAMVAAVAFFIHRWAGLGADHPRPRQGSLTRGFSVMAKSRYLLFVFFMIAVVQVVITLVDFRTNQLLETTFPDLDQRTAVIGQIYAAIDVGAMVLQVSTGGILRLLGVPLVLMGIPVVLLLVMSPLLVAPIFATLAVAKVGGKVMDYSIFRAAKEILYIPLSPSEKTEGKAVVDMFTYRVAKGGASLLLLALGHWALQRSVDGIALALLLLWFSLAWIIARRFRALVPRDRELEKEEGS
jgi:AAA family ATP:ADP antiporter